MKIYRHKKSGFTLIELIAVMAIMPLVVSAVYESIIVGYKLLNVAYKSSSVREESKVFINTMSSQLKNCRYYEDTDDIRNDPALNFLQTSGYTGVTYIEGFDNKRYMYVLKPNGSKKDLYLYTFDKPEVQAYKYVPDTRSNYLGYDFSNIYAFYINYETYHNYTTDTTNIIPGDVSSLVDGFSSIGLTSAVSGDNFVYYDTIDNKFYLIGKSASDFNYYKISLKVKSKVQSDFACTAPGTQKKIMDKVDSAEVTKSTSNDNMCTLSVATKDAGKNITASTDVYIDEAADVYKD